MQKPLTNYAFIDGNNLYRGIQGLGWKLDALKTENETRRQALDRAAWVLRWVGIRWCDWCLAWKWLLHKHQAIEEEDEE